MKCDKECLDFIDELMDLLEPSGQALRDDEIYKKRNSIGVIE